ncbi:twin-arginine translocation pathway signal protein [Cognatishimia sp.]|uniref:Acg family FMN-binding oxidoreductase n=1 Tax=Cognatishimia sp. TaxID=2211648 RepID=UPI003512C5A5|nr:twin-arginine translocation pathway signal protein [Cognatishimia sp.]
MTLSRRKAIALVGGGLILVAGGATGYRVTRRPQTALKPWELAGTYVEPRQKALSFALLSPNPHNLQPWLVDLSEPDTVVLYANPEKLLPETDPMSRQITIGLGAFLEVMRMAAAHDGYRVDFEYFPDGSSTQMLDARPIARAVFVKDPDQSPDPLFGHVLARRSNKEPYDTSRPVAAETVDILKAASAEISFGSTLDAEDITYFREMTAEALFVELKTPRTHMESVDVFRIGHREVDASPDGIDLSGPMFEGLKLAGMFNRAQAADPNSMAYQGGLDMVASYCATAMGYVWLTTEGNTRIDQLNAGRNWVRVNLAATGLGLGIHPLSQALQEYPEMAAHYQDIHARLAPEGGTVQMFGRIGYGPDLPPSPHWTLEHKIVAS